MSSAHPGLTPLLILGDRALAFENGCRDTQVVPHRRGVTCEWYAGKKDFPSVVLMRRYLKLALAEAQSRGLMATPLTEGPSVTFSLDYIPIQYPDPAEPLALVRRQT